MDMNGKDQRFERLKLLLDRYLAKVSTPDETAELFASFAAGDDDDDIHSLFVAHMAGSEPMADYRADEWDGVFREVTRAARLAESNTPVRRLPGRLFTWLSAAAVVLACIGIFRYQQTSNQQAALALDIPPGKPGATLTLADGTKIALADAAEGQLAAENGVVIRKTDTGALTYELTGTSGTPNQVNELATARGETFRVRLPDGSMVWLNAGSVLRYPSRFEAVARTVEIVGEGYFEIAKATRRFPLRPDLAGKIGRDSGGANVPFNILANGQQIQVLGTAFNISAYPDDPWVTTTVTEGTVKVMADAETFGILKAGKEAVSEPGAMTIRQGNVAAAVSWKAGDFVWENEPLTAIMKKIERWYDVEVSYEGDPTGITFYGMVSRDKSVRSVLEVMGMTGKVKFRIEEGNANREGRRIVVII